MTDFVLAGGRVIDPANGIDAPMDVVVRDGRIASVVTPAAPATAFAARM